MPLLLLPTGSAAAGGDSALDTAWGVGGTYWHRYNDWGPRRLYPQQRGYLSTPDLLTSALLENVLLGGADTGKRAGLAATHVDRRLVPTQPVRLQPDLLATAELENELLGAADTAKRANVPASHVDRRMVPQYTLRKSAVGLLDTGLLETPGNPTTATLPAVTHARLPWLRVKPSQADASSAPGGPALDPTQAGPGTAWRWRRDPSALIQRDYRSAYGLLDTALVENELLGGAGTWMRAATPATHADRREVPQQRTYISDPSFYPSIAPTDPLTLAWGVGGTYWLIYNTAALQVSRRLVPTQRDYRSDPALLLTALLEDALLGGADNLGRHRETLAGWRPAVTVRSRLTGDLSPLTAADVLLLAGAVGGDRWRRYHTPETNRAAAWWRQPRVVVATAAGVALVGTSTATYPAGPSSGSTAPVGPASAGTYPAGAGSVSSALGVPNSTGTSPTGPTSRGGG